MQPTLQPPKTNSVNAAVVHFAPRPKKKEGVNLISGEAAEKRPRDELSANEASPDWISFFKPNVTITMVDDFTAYPADKVPDHVWSPTFSNLRYEQGKLGAVVGQSLLDLLGCIQCA